MKTSFVLASVLSAALAAEQPPVQRVKHVDQDERGGFQVHGERVNKAETAGQAAGSDPVEHPDFEPYPDPKDFASAVLFEQFADSPDALFERWHTSSALKKDSAEGYSYVGEWAFEEPTEVPGFVHDKGLVLKTPAALHAISRKFDQVLDNTDNTLVLQYEVKLQQGLQCGGAYVKLLAASADLDSEEFSSDTPYVVMFGPDKCGHTDKVHLIIRTRDAATGEYEEKHLRTPPRTRSGKLSTLYTLILNRDQTFEIRINGNVALAGSLLDEHAFKPELNPPREIDDPEDTKPEDWVEEQYIPDPDQAEKPDDWDEDAPQRIPDPDAVQPEDWRVDLEAYIADPDASQPEEWDEEEDGEWIAPLVENPACKGLSGCGKWTVPLIKNPEYKGKWSQPTVLNPAYKGEWAPRKIPNPEYDETSRPGNLEPIGGVGLELWTMQPDILFDNFYIGHSVEEAELLGNATWSPKFYVETLENSRHVPPAQSPEDSEGSAFDDFKADPLYFLARSYNEFITEFSYDKVGALRNHPLATVIFSFVFGLITVGLFGLFNAVLKTVTGKEIPRIEQEKKAKVAKTTKPAKGPVAPVAPVVIEPVIEPVDVPTVVVETETDLQPVKTDVRRRKV